MPAALSIKHVLPGYAAIIAACLPSSAVSQEAETIGKVKRSLVNQVEQSRSLFGLKTAAIALIWQVSYESSQPNWDGYDALPVNHSTIFEASAFIRALPDNVPIPEVSAEPDGAVSLDWILSRKRMLSLSIRGTGRIGFAWLDGSNKGHAVVQFDGESISPRVLNEIYLLVDHGSSSLRTA